jgi:hypothetical protein
MAGLLEDHTIAFLVHIKHILRTDAIGITCANGMHAFFRSITGFATSFVKETSSFTD